MACAGCRFILVQKYFKCKDSRHHTQAFFLSRSISSRMQTGICFNTRENAYLLSYADAKELILFGTYLPLCKRCRNILNEVVLERVKISIVLRPPMRDIFGDAHFDSKGWFFSVQSLNEDRISRKARY